MARTHNLCERCDDQDRVTLATVVDHIKPLALGGSDEDSNTRNLCDECHAIVTAEQFGQQVTKEGRGIGRSGRPTSPDHSWNRPKRT